MDSTPSDSAPQPPQPSQPSQPSSSAPASHVGWYRFAVLISGSEATAQSALAGAFEAIADRLPRLRTAASRRAWMVARLRKAVLRTEKEATSAAEPWSRIAALPEPARTAYALFQTVEVGANELAELAGTRTTAALAEALATARRKLRPEAVFPLDALLPLHCPWAGAGEGEGDLPAVAQAVESVGEKAASELQAQVALDEEWQARVGELALPEGVEIPTSSEAATGAHSLAKHPALIAVIIALGVMVGAAIFVAKQQMEEFPGREMVSTLVEMAEGDGGPVLEEIKPQAISQLGDWFLLNGFDEFTPPAELRSLKAVACRVLRYEGVPVAQMILEESGAHLFIYPSARQTPRVESREWVQFQHDDWAVATRSDDEFTYIVAYPGSLEELDGFLK